ncbi:flavin reductase family protein [Amycolatopsis acidiphila]|uniref:Flavin reductase family protein n=1 Tax=Amycolatopsis acidiphila TaxID=715473 RepID=A0A558AJ52_9PSEU|nr:flavin reductase family protein [Amycolatopsis acidiphila]TVT24279.1 flavin reductase family protein [Amycolatopsis acidiphila]UIJ62591.1 flavin reductase family protein [Amycolatopsis acidiphila]GHG85628.1 hypothetical protein GCM10017788_58430 [Amycolatopsis acidiphila]
MSSATTVPGEDVRGFHRRFVTGVTIVTTMADGVPRGLAVNAFASVTVSPAVILVCVAKTSSTHEVLFRAERFAVNLLAHDQLPVARTFAAKGADKFAGLAWHQGHHGTPVLDGTCAHLEAEIAHRIRTSTHTVFLGSVLHAHSTPLAPLLYTNSQFYDGSELVPALG